MLLVVRVRYWNRVTAWPFLHAFVKERCSFYTRLSVGFYIILVLLFQFLDTVGSASSVSGNRKGFRPVLTTPSGMQLQAPVLEVEIT